MEVCRFRKNNDGTGYPLGDIQRSETVRNLMVTVAKKLVSNIGKLDQFVDILQRNVETSLSGTDLTWFVTKAIGINLDTGVQGNALPGMATPPTTAPAIAMSWTPPAAWP